MIARANRKAAGPPTPHGTRTGVVRSSFVTRSTMRANRADVEPSDSTCSNLDGITRQAQKHFLQLLSHLKDPDRLAQNLKLIRDYLECMVLDTSEYELAVKRIGNAQRYLEFQETGAARYELRLLIGSLQKHLEYHGRRQSERQPSSRPFAARLVAQFSN